MSTKKEYIAELERAEHVYKESVKTNSCKAILDTYYELQKVKKFYKVEESEEYQDYDILVDEDTIT